MTTTENRSPARYTNFYFVLLLLSSITTGFVLLLNLVGIPQFISDFQLSPTYGIIGIFGLIVLLINSVAILLLWLKENPLAIGLAIGSYAAGLVTNILEMFTVSPIVKSIVDQSMQPGDPPGTREFNEVSANVLVYGGYILGILVIIILGILWWFAYKSQKRAEQTARPS